MLLYHQRETTTIFFHNSGAAHNPVWRLQQHTISKRRRLIVYQFSKVNLHSCVKYLQLSFEVCVLTYGADSTHCRTYHALTLMRQLIRAFPHNFGDVAWKQRCKENNTVVPKSIKASSSNTIWTSIENIYKLYKNV